MTWFARLIIGLIIAVAGSYFYQKHVIGEVNSNIETSEGYEYDSDDKNEDDYAYDDYDTEYDW